jgi:predicted O-methyltransferase YrrM
MVAFWRRNLELMRAARFPATAAGGGRYWTGNELYASGDAAILLAMLSEARPRQVVEVGSGFSSACMLDIADWIALPTRFTFVEPFPDRLQRLLTDADRGRCEIIEAFIQQVDLARFEALQRNDILFIDSTHVSKAGSDVNHELFEILPRLQPGVIVHFHDCFWPFEYPDEWIFESRRSWNELYLLRAYLTGNRDFEVLFFNDYFRARHPNDAARLPAFAENPGGGLWLRRTG